MAQVFVEQPELLQVSNSHSTIIGGGIHNTSITTIHSRNESIPKASSRGRRESVRGFFNKIKITTENKTGASVVAEYSPLKEPDFEVCPILLQVDFYRGVEAAGNEQYSPESNFTPGVDKWKGQRVALEQLHDSLGKTRCRHVSLVGGAGSGKTTLLKRYARGLAEGKISVKIRERPDVCRRLTMPRRRKPFFGHFINVRDLPIGGTFTPCELIFKSMVKELSKDELNAGYNKLINNQENCIFIIDGLDQYDWQLENESAKIDYFTSTTVPSIIYNLLCGELFPNAWVVTSSRQHKIRFFQDRLRADKIIVLNGLEQPDIEHLAVALPKSDTTVWSRLSERCPNLLIMCRTPLFLIFTVLVFICKTDFSLDTMAGVMTVFIQCFVESKYATISKESSTLQKLKKLAFQGTVERRVLFTEDDFKTVDLKSEDAQDLIIFAPRQTSIIIREKLFSDDYVMFFCHQSVQETFAMLHISKMDVNKFRQFLEENINVPHFSVVRRLLCGFLLNRETYEATHGLFQVSDHEEKKVLLAVFLKEALEAHLSRQDYLELLSSLYESGSGADSLLDSHPSYVKLSRFVLTPTDAYVLGRILSRMHKLDIFELWDTDLNEEKMNIIWNEIQKSNLQIKSLDVHSNHRYDFDCGTLFKMIVHCEVEKLNINDCSLTDERLQKCASFPPTKLVKVDISRSEKLGSIGIAIIGNVVKNSQNEFKKLNIAKCNLTKNKIRCLHRSLGKTKIEILDINYNRSMGTQGARIMGQIVEDSSAKKVNMSRCDQTAEEISAFAKGLGEATMDVLDITTHELKKYVTMPYVDAISKLLPHVTQELKMIDWKINERMKSMVQQHIDDSAHPDFKLVYEDNGRCTLTKQT
ncbi:NACHT, LRR and PYD domains-containing protein 5-like [Styela clava]